MKVEHIIVDGGSTDGTRQLLKRYSSENPLIKWVSEPDDGIYDAMNKGIQMSSGDIVGILNSDDRLSGPSVIARIQELFCRHIDCDAILGGVDFVDHKGMVVRRVRTDGFKPSMLRSGWMPPHPGLFLRRSVYTNHGGYKTDYDIAADYEFCVRLFLRSNISFQLFPSSVVNMNLGGKSTSGLASTLTISREIVRSCEENAVVPNYVMLILRLPLKVLKQVNFRSLFRRI